MNAPLSTPAAASAPQYVLVRADELRLLLPQSDVGVAEYLDGALEPLDGAGLLLNPADAEASKFYAALSSHMKPLPEAPEGRFLTTTLGDAGDPLHWCWNEVRVVPGSAITPLTLPPALRAPYSPITEFALFEDHVVFLCDAARVTEFAFAHRT
ncbi:hypothetical protein [Ottowia testudinis]|uniref:Uncharacterized protein n=1 Tax=Ottowia testudinis TaxID=2816950 RepID=A0A975CL09_9BURK|nr:hypothetical protein [Ottowia testudinis]QTD45418.1 hypothetical protein J1M35_00350 [Ottowia testudinis]